MGKKHLDITPQVNWKSEIQMIKFILKRRSKPCQRRQKNMSFQSGHFPDVLKSAQITPLLKIPTLDCEILKNYRPVPNLKFLAKTIERSCASQLQDYLW